MVALERAAERGAADAKVLVCSIRSCTNNAWPRSFARENVGLVIYDECHHAAAEDNPARAAPARRFRAGLARHLARLHGHHTRAATAKVWMKCSSASSTRARCRI
ncbi:MAG: DEAD/DEAH box helicase family protein [Pseudomonadota bacterium]